MSSKFKTYLNAHSISFIIVIITSVGCTFLPLLNSLGYEFSVLNSTVLSFLAGIITIASSKMNIQFYNKKFKFSKKLLITLTILILIPVFISSVTTLLFQVCPIWDGMMVYVTFVPAAVFVGVIIGMVSIQAGKGRYILYLFLYISILLLPILEIYFRPQIYLYHPIITFFPGTIYDEEITINAKLLYYRIYSLLPFIIMIPYLRLNKKFKKLYFSLPIFILLIGLEAYFKPIFEFSTTQEVLSEHLKGEAVTSHFIINYPASLSKEEFSNLVLHHEYYYNKIAEDTHIEPGSKIRSFVFKDRKQKRELFGAGNADVSKPWLGQIYTQKDSYNTSLKHEIVHSFSAEIGSTFLKLASGWNPALIEGYAMAVENNSSNYDIHYLAYLARINGYDFPIETLFTGFNFMTRTSSISYIYAGSFIKYLSEKYGIDRVNLLYGNLNFKSAFGKEINYLAPDYYQFLDTLKFENNPSIAQLFYGRQPLIKKVCPRVTAIQLATAWEHYSDNDYKEADSLFSRIYKYSGSYSAFIGSIESKEKLSDYAGAYKAISAEIQKFSESSYYFPLLIKYADLAVIQDNYILADSLYNIILSSPPNEYYYCIAASRLDLGIKNRNQLSIYIKGSSADRMLILMNIIDDNRDNLPTMNLLMSLAENNNVSPEIIEHYYKFNSTRNDIISAYTYNRISESFLSRGEYQKATDFSKRAYEISSPERKVVFKENYEKVGWIENHADSILRKLSFN